MANALSSRNIDEYQRCLRCMWWLLPLVTLLMAAPTIADTSLTTSFYDTSCPNLHSTVQKALFNEIRSDWRIGASLLRLMFHDCFVQGCDASILLSDTATFTGEKGALANNNSLRGFEAFDRVKAAVENVCPGVVSCADTLVIVAMQAVVAAGGPYWAVELGRRDSLTASLELAGSDLPLANDNVDTLISLFAAKNLDQTDMVALTGAHTFGKAQCPTFRARLYDFSGTSAPDSTLDTSYLAELQAVCPQGGSNTTTVDLDQATATRFDHSYYSNILINRGLLSTDQALQDGGNTATAATVSTFATDENKFFTQFASAMVKMGRISPLTGAAGEIRTKCSVVNPVSSS